MPVGPYKTFGACVAAIMKKKNSRTGKMHTKESAEKICGHMEQMAKMSEHKKSANEKVMKK